MTTEYLGIWTHRRLMAPKMRMIRTLTDKSCWICKYLGTWTGDTFIQDFTCTWFPKHGKGEEKKLWPQKDPDVGRGWGENDI